MKSDARLYTCRYKTLHNVNLLDLFERKHLFGLRADHRTVIFLSHFFQRLRNKQTHDNKNGKLCSCSMRRLKLYIFRSIDWWFCSLLRRTRIRWASSSADCVRSAACRLCCRRDGTASNERKATGRLACSTLRYKPDNWDFGPRYSRCSIAVSWVPTVRPAESP